MPLSPRTLRPSSSFTPRSISGLALWLDASATGDLYTTDAGPVTAVSSPTEIAGCALWLDGADSSAASMTLSGSLVETWKDKSGNGRNFTASGSARPTLTAAALNGNSVVTFDGTANQMLATGGFLQTANVTILTVFKYNSGQYGGIISSCDSATANDASPRLVIHNGSFRQFGYGNFSDVAQGTSPTLVSGVVSAGASSIYQTGSLGDSDAVSGTLTTGSAQTAVGSYRINAGNYLNGYIAEIVVFLSALSTADRARVEAYLAAKWGIAGVHAAATSASDPVGYWRDRSGNNRHATQATASYRGVVGTQGSRRAITLDGTDDHLLLGNLSAAFPTAGEVVAAYALNAVDSSYTVYQTSDNLNSDVFGGLTFAGAFRNSRLAGLSFTGPSSVGTHLWGVSSASAGYNLWVEGSNALTTTADHTGGNNHAIGMRSASPGSNQAMNGKLLEVCAFNRVLTSSERLRLNRYLAARWGITLAPQVSNADAQAWVNRVYANGGTVTSSTAAAVNQFCNDIDSAGIRDRFYRMGIFAGTGLNAALVPLYRGPSLGGTQYGNTTDTNVGPFVSGDYVETGAGGGLLGNGTSKYLNTGLSVSDIGTAASGHLSAYHGLSSGASSNRYYMGANDASTGNRFYLGTDAFTTAAVFGSYGLVQNASQALAAQGHGPAGHRILSRETASLLTHYHNGSVVATNTTTITPAVSTAAFAVFAANRNGTVDRFHNSWIAAYSIGLGMTSEQAAAYYTAMQAFQTALGRNV